MKVVLYPVQCAWCRTDIPDVVSEVKGSSGICQPCIDKHFPEVALVLSQDTADIVGVPQPPGFQE
jgi:hypothetical protein